MSKTTIEVDTAALNENARVTFHYHLDSFVRALTGMSVKHTVTHSAPPVVVDPTPVKTKGTETADSATPTGHKQK